MVASPSRKIMWPDCSPPRIAPGLQHLLQHVLVADVGAQHPDARIAQCDLQTHVRHRSRHDRRTGQRRHEHCMSRATSRSTASPLTTCPFASLNRARSASPSKVTPRSNCPFFSAIALATASGCSAPQLSLMFLPSGACTEIMSPAMPQARNSSGASAVAAPLAQSTSTRNPAQIRIHALRQPFDVSVPQLRLARKTGSRLCRCRLSVRSRGFCSSAKISCSMASSCESGNLYPSPEKTLMPLSGPWIVRGRNHHPGGISCANAPDKPRPES